MSLLILHHYTTPKAYAAIKKSGVIKATRVAGDDASHGPGVYLTSLGPHECQTKIAGNNWGDGVKNERAILAMGKVDCCYQVRIPEDDPDIRQVESGPRDIYLYSGDIYLDNYDHTRVNIKVDGDRKEINTSGTLHVTGDFSVGSGVTNVRMGQAK